MAITNVFFERAIEGKKLVLFGSGSFAEKIMDKYLSWYEISYICDNDSKKWNSELKGTPIFSPLKLLEEDKKGIVVLIATSFKCEIVPWFIENGINYIDIDVFKTPPYKDIIVNSSKDYLLERCTNRKLLVYGVGNNAKKLSDMLFKNNLRVEYYIDNKPDCDTFGSKEVKSYLDIVYEIPDSFFVIIANDEKEYYADSRQRFMQLGLIENINFTYYTTVPDYETSYHFDVLLSYNRIRKKVVGYKIEGFEVFGNLDDKDALKIVALGGSTTESTHACVKGWARFLTDIFIENRIPVIMYCGGISGYTSSQELLKLIRDVLPMKPDVVLSYSGFNDANSYYEKMTSGYSECENRPIVTNFQVSFLKEILKFYSSEKQTVYYGLKNNKTPAELWFDNMRTMRAISNEFNILFLSFLQPYIFFGNYTISVTQKIILNRKWSRTDCERLGLSKRKINSLVDITNEIVDLTKDVEYIHDFTNIFSEYTNIYRDVCHVTELGNEVVAKNIYRILEEHLEGGRIK